MGAIQHRPQGPDYNQNAEPSETPAGAIWWSRTEKAMHGCNDIVWEGAYGFGQSGNGYAMGGWNGSYLSDINRLSFIGETLVIIGNLNVVRAGPATLSTATVGYSAGGNGGSGDLTSIERFTYSTEVSSPIGALLLSTHAEPVGLHSSVHGFVMGNISTNVDRFTFSSETTTTSGLTFPTTSREMSGYSAKTDAYCVGGADPMISTIRKLTFSPETFTAVSNSLTRPKSKTACFPGQTSGLITGGRIDVAGTPTSEIEEMLYATEVSSVVADYIDSVQHGTPVQSTSVGYNIGGQTVSGGGVTDRVNVVNLILHTTYHISSTLGYGLLAYGAGLSARD